MNSQNLIAGFVAAAVAGFGYWNPGSMPILIGLMWGMLFATLTTDKTMSTYVRQELEEAAIEIQEKSNLET